MPSLEGEVIGQVTLDPGATTVRELRIHVDPQGGGANRGTIDISLQAASGLDRTFDTSSASVELVAASDANGSFPPAREFPVERCAAGCDLTYGIAISLGPNQLPASVVRYIVDVRLEYARALIGSPALVLQLDGPASGLVPPAWGLIAALAAGVLGRLAAPALDARLDQRRRRWPAVCLALLLAGMAALMLALSVFSIGSYLQAFGAGYLTGRPNLLPLPTLILGSGDTWSLSLMAILAWGVVRGIRRWTLDGGWTLGLATLAATGLGEVWLAYWLASGAAVQPFFMALPMVLLGALGGLVLGQAWRTEAHSRHDRWLAGLAVVSHGAVLASLGFVGLRGVLVMISPLLVTILMVPAVAMGIALRRWFSGRRGLLIAVDLVLALVGALVYALFMAVGVFLANPWQPGIGTVAMAIGGLGLALGIVTALQRLHGVPGQPGATGPATLATADSPGPARWPDAGPPTS